MVDAHASAGPSPGRSQQHRRYRTSQPQSPLPINLRHAAPRPPSLYEEEHDSLSTAMLHRSSSSSMSRQSSEASTRSLTSAKRSSNLPQPHLSSSRHGRNSDRSLSDELIESVYTERSSGTGNTTPIPVSGMDASSSAMSRQHSGDSHSRSRRSSRTDSPSQRGLARRRSSNVGIGLVIGMAPSPSASDSNYWHPTPTFEIGRSIRMGRRSSSSHSLSSGQRGQDRPEQLQHGAQSLNSPALAPRTIRAKEDRKNLRDRPNETISLSAELGSPGDRDGTPRTPTSFASAASTNFRKFIYDLLHTWRRLILEVGFPFLRAFLLVSRDALGFSDQRPVACPNHIPETTAPSLLNRMKVFAEVCKFTMVTSYLLTPKLSISLYEENPDVQSGIDSTGPSTESRAAESESLSLRMPSWETDLHVVHGTVRHWFSNAPWQEPSLTQSSHSTAFESVSIKAGLLAAAALWFISASSAAWFRTLLLLISLVWSSSLVGRSISVKGSKRMQYQILHPRKNPCPSPGLLEYLATCAHHTRFQSSASNLVQSARSTDLEFNRCLTAIQEIELVSRGFKIGQYPMPQISRIEATTTAGSSRLPSVIGSPVMQSGQSMADRSTSANSFESSEKHAGVNADGIRGNSPSPSGREASVRMFRLRKALSHAFEEAEESCRLLKSKLEPLTEETELSALQDLYSLDAGVKSFDDPTHGIHASYARLTHPDDATLIRSGVFGTPLKHTRGDSATLTPQSLVTLGPQTRALVASHADDSIASVTSVSSNTKRASWNTLPRSAGASLMRPNGRENLLLAAWVNDPSRENWSQSISNKRNSLESGSSQSSAAALSRNNSLLKTRNEETLLEEWDTNDFSGRMENANRASPTPPSAAFSATAHERNQQGPRTGSRLSYIAEKSAGHGPNESPAAKRLSYQSSSAGVPASPHPNSHTALHEGRRTSIDGNGPTASVIGSPIAHTSIWPTSPSGPSRNGSLRLSGRRGQAGTNIASVNALTSSPLLPRSAPPAATELVAATDRFSLLGLRQAFEHYHTVRRQTLCSFLALDFEGHTVAKTSSEVAGNTMTDYWDVAHDAVCFCTKTLDRVRKSVFTAIQSEMLQLERSPSIPGSVSEADAASKTTQSATTGHDVFPAHTGFEDRAQGLGSAIRSIQVKLRSCLEELKLADLAVSSQLHGAADAQPAPRSHGDAAERRLNAENVWESIREDLLAVTQEWEGGSKILRSQRKQNQVPDPATRDSDSAAQLAFDRSMARELESPLEADEDSFHQGEYGNGGSTHDRKASALSISSIADSHITTSSSDSTENFSRLLMPAMSPDHLPPPGLEEVFESIAGIAASLQEERRAKKSSRQERIDQVKEQRKEAQRRAALGLPASDVLDQADRKKGAKPPPGVVTELKDVLGKLREEKEQLRLAATKRVQDGTAETQETTNQATSDVKQSSINSSLRPNDQAPMQSPTG